MRKFGRFKSVLCAAMMLAAVPAAHALDGKAPPAESAANSVDAFREGVRAYFAGDKATALSSLEMAAAGEHAMAQWKLARMYAEGDGVAENDLKAFQYFSRIANAHADEAPGSPQAPFVASAFVALGGYYLTGIKDSEVKPNRSRARDLYTYAASYFGDADAQYRLGCLYLEGDGGERNPRLAGRWLKLAAEKGHALAQAKLGEMLFSGDDLPRRPVDGLMWLTIAVHQIDGSPSDDWVRLSQEQAFSLASEKERRTATDRADRWLAANLAE